MAKPQEDLLVLILEQITNLERGQYDLELDLKIEISMNSERQELCNSREEKSLSSTIPI